MPKIINGKKYNTIEESILNGEKKIEKRAKKIFIEAKKNRVAKEKEKIRTLEYIKFNKK